MDMRPVFVSALLAAPREVGNPVSPLQLTSWPKVYAEPFLEGKHVVPVLACSKAASRHAPKDTATVQFCVLALSGLTAAASW